MVYCEFCGIYVRVEHGDEQLVCPRCNCPLLWCPAMDNVRGVIQ